MSDRYVDTINSAAEIVEFVGKYSLSEPIDCTIANCRTPHKKGYDVRLKSGELGRIGNVCGKKLLGARTYQRLQQELVERENKKALQQIIRSPKFDVGRAIAALDSWRPKLRLMGRIRVELEHNAPAAAKALIAAVRTKMDGKNPTAASFRAIEGRRWLVSDANSQFAKATGYLNRIRALLSKPNMTDADLHAVIRAAGSARLLLKSVADALDAFVTFCRPHNLSRVTAWVTEWNINYPVEGVPPLHQFEGFSPAHLPPDTDKVDRACLECLDTGR